MLTNLRPRHIYDVFIHSAVVRNAIADHFITGLALTSSHPRPYKETVHKLDENMVRQKLAKVDWSPTLERSNPNDIIKIITEEFDRIYNKCLTTKKVIINDKLSSSWISDKLIQMSKINLSF